MFGLPIFYNGSIRKYVIIFGSLFNDIMIQRVDAEGNILDTLKVPLTYGNKDRYLVRLKEDEDLRRTINQQLPRMSFEIKNVYYDPSRKLNSIQQNTIQNANNEIFGTQYAPVPYNFDISLSVLTRNADDGLRIIEQIVPFFKPEWTVSANLIPDMGIKNDIPIILKSVQPIDTAEAGFTDKYIVGWELTFTLKGNLFGPISMQGLIKEVIVNFYTPSSNTAQEGVGTTSKAEYYIITPGLTANGQPTSNSSLSIPSNEIAANSNYGFIEDFCSNVGD